MRIVDFHSHFFSRPFFDALASASPLPGSTTEKLARVIEKTGIELPASDEIEHLARWTRDLDAKGVEHLVTFASLPEEVPAVGRAAAESNGRVTPMAIVNPLAPGAPETVGKLLSETGFRGALMFPAMHHFRVDDEAVQPTLTVLNEQGAVLYVHCGLLVVKLRDLLGIPRPYDLTYANPLSIIPAASAHPNVRFVIPHFGAGFLRETLFAGTQCDNVYVDTSSSNSWVATQPAKTTLSDVFERALGVFGPERILFGTDSNVFPIGWRQDRFEEQDALCRAIGLSADERALIFGANALRLLD